jgi:hypothetical protein
MGKDVDEDLIEATIRRVQEQAARAAASAEVPPELGDGGDTPSGAQALDGQVPADDLSGAGPEDHIEAAVRRVAAAKAERELAPEPARAPVEPIVAPVDIAAPPEAPSAEEDDPFEVTRRRFAATRPAFIDPDDADDGAPYAAEAPLTIEVLARRLDELAARVARLESAGQPSLEVVGEAPVARAASARGPVPMPAPRPLTAAPVPERQDYTRFAEQAPTAPPRRGLDLLPRTYRITVEDKRRGVDLVPLHRALLSLEGVRDMSLLSYTNGVAIVSVETSGPLDQEQLGATVSRAMARRAVVEVHNEQTMVVKIGEE